MTESIIVAVVTVGVVGGFGLWTWRNLEASRRRSRTLFDRWEADYQTLRSALAQLDRKDQLRTQETAQLLDQLLQGERNGVALDIPIDKPLTAQQLCALVAERLAEYDRADRVKGGRGYSATQIHVVLTPAARVEN